MKTRLRLFTVSFGRMFLVMAVAAALAVGSAQPVVAATQIDIAGPAGSGAFGTSVTVLPNGNIVVTDPYYDAGEIADVGAVYLYDGATGAQISALTGSTAGDQVGYDDVIVLRNGNYVVRSTLWDNVATGAVDAGAVTWGSGASGVSGVVSATNSLVGSTGLDRVGYYGVTALSNGNYVVPSPYWDNGSAADAGAATWGNGSTGVSGVVSATNSLVGSTAGDRVGDGSGGPSVWALSNGNYVVTSPNWDNGTAADAGAVTWGSGASGVSGPVSAANSLVGSTAGDWVGYYGVTALSNGNYVVRSPGWDNGAAADAGTVTWGNGTTGTAGVASAANSLVGGAAGDGVGYLVTELSNGDYVVISPWWDNGAVADAGAVTWGSGTTGVKDVVSAANSLVGSTGLDRVGYYGVTALSNDNYVVPSPYWDNGTAVDAGAATWGNGSTGVSGVVSATNSLVGNTAYDQVGYGYPGVWALSNGNYAVRSEFWDNGAIIDAGAITWGNGTTGTSGVVSTANSLVGSTAHDHVGYGYPGLTALSNGNYVVSSFDWDNGAIVDAGAATWGNGTTGTSGVVSAANSLVGSTAYDQVGYGYPGVWALSNGNYVVCSQSWDNGAIVNAGAATWGDGTTGTSGPVSTANSLVGSTGGDHVGYGYPGLTALSNGNYVVSSFKWDNGAIVDAGAATWGNGTTGTSGVVSTANSLVGSTAHDHVGYGYPGVWALSNGNYAVRSEFWDNGAIVDAGAITWGSGTTGLSGVVSAANSLVGSTAYDRVGSWDVTPLSNGNYVALSPYWDNGAVADSGAVTWGNRTGGAAGPITADNSVRGTAEKGGESMRWAYDGVNRQLVVGRPADNIVTLFVLPPIQAVFLPVVLKSAP